MSANLNYWTAPHNSDNGFPDSDGRRDERREMGWLSRSELWYRALSHVKSFYWMCRRGTRPPSGIPQVSEPSLHSTLSTIAHIHIPRHTHKHTLSLPLANSLKRVTLVLQLPVKRGEHCLWVNKVEVTDQVNLREQGFHFLRTFLWTPNMSLTARSDSSGTWWLMLWPQVKKALFQILIWYSSYVRSKHSRRTFDFIEVSSFCQSLNEINMDG